MIAINWQGLRDDDASQEALVLLDGLLGGDESRQIECCRWLCLKAAEAPGYDIMAPKGQRWDGEGLHHSISGHIREALGVDESHHALCHHLARRYYDLGGEVVLWSLIREAVLEGFRGPLNGPIDLQVMVPLTWRGPLSVDDMPLQGALFAHPVVVVNYRERHRYQRGSFNMGPLENQRRLDEDAVTEANYRRIMRSHVVVDDRLAPLGEVLP